MRLTQLTNELDLAHRPLMLDSNCPVYPAVQR